MLTITLYLDGDGCWPDLPEKKIIHLGKGGNDAPAIEIALLDNSTPSDKDRVTLRLNLPENQVVLVETSLDLFIAAAKKLDSVRQARTSRYN